MRSILMTMTIAATSCAAVRSEGTPVRLARRVRQQHERITLTRNGEAEAVLLSVECIVVAGMEMTPEILGDSEAVARILGKPGQR